jgi:uncharacterized membrane protein YdjX (TVP38/TMEM64 family)
MGEIRPWNRASCIRAAMPVECNQTEPPRSAHGFAMLRLLPLVVIVGVAGLVIAAGGHRHLSLETLLRYRVDIDTFVAMHRAVAIIALIALYTAAVAFSIPAAAGLTICGGLIFGGLTGAIAAITAATLGATIVFLIAKAAMRGVAPGDAGTLAAATWRSGRTAERFAAGFHKDAFWYLVSLRLMPVFPFWLINLASAPCGIPLRTFVAATAIGIIPANFAYAFFGAGLDSSIAAQASAYRACLATLQTNCHLDFDLMATVTPQLIAGLIAFGLIAVIPPVVRHLMSKRHARRVQGVAKAVASEVGGTLG